MNKYRAATNVYSGFLCQSNTPSTSPAIPDLVVGVKNGCLSYDQAPDYKLKFTDRPIGNFSPRNGCDVSSFDAHVESRALLGETPEFVVMYPHKYSLVEISVNQLFDDANRLVIFWIGGWATAISSALYDANLLGLQDFEKGIQQNGPASFSRSENRQSQVHIHSKDTFEISEAARASYAQQLTCALSLAPSHMEIYEALTLPVDASNHKRMVRLLEITRTRFCHGLDRKQLNGFLERLQKIIGRVISHVNVFDVEYAATFGTALQTVTLHGMAKLPDEDAKTTCIPVRVKINLTLLALTELLDPTEEDTELKKVPDEIQAPSESDPIATPQGAVGQDQG